MRTILALLLLCVPTFVGCSKTESPQPATSDQPPTSTPDDSNHAAAVSATRFLNAMIQGDEPTAFGRLTPLAAEQMTKNGKTFSFIQFDKADFQVTKVWQPKTDEAAVEYRMTAKAGDESGEFDICCFMRNIGGDWRLGGIAYDMGDGQPAVHNYEADETPSVRPAAQTVAAPNGASEAPQTARNTTDTQLR